MARRNEPLLRLLDHALRSALRLSLAPMDELLAAGEAMSSEDRELFLRTAHDNQLRLQKHAEQLLDVVALEDGLLRCRFRRTDIVSALQAYLNTFTQAAEHRRTRVTFESDSP